MNIPTRKEEIVAEINVERKAASIWPWIINLLVLLLLGWAIVELLDSDEREIAAVDPVAAPVVAPPVTPVPGATATPGAPVAPVDRIFLRP